MQRLKNDRGGSGRDKPLESAVKQWQHGLGTAISRREAISAGGLVIAGAAGLGASSSSTPGIIFGADYSGYLGFHAANPLAVGLRWYFNVENQFPDTWPTHPFAHTHMTLSVRPHPADLFAGKLDHKLKALIESAPKNSELTFWHENVRLNPRKYPSYVSNPHTAVRLQKYGQKLCKGTDVLFGVITVGQIALLPDWMAPGLDWYGDDLYEFPQLRGPNNSFSKSKLSARLSQNHRAWQKISGQKKPNLRICETNTPYDAHRVEWFTTIADWLPAHNANRMLTYWNAQEGLAQGGLSGAWPPSQPVISRLASLATKFSWKTA
jgi:hypothetical protein